jgi:hypothetical protein
MLEIPIGRVLPGALVPDDNYVSAPTTIT